MTNNTETRRDVWSRYWASGALHSCATSYRNNYAGSIGAFWQEAFAGLSTPACVLDIATGNAALPNLLLATRQESGIECDAIDLARIEPEWLRKLEPAQRQRIRLHGGVAAEALPFPDNAFDLVVSQYGIEYTDLARSLAELLRVVTRRGRIRLVAHHAQSLPVRLAGEEIDHIDWLLKPDGLIDLSAGMISPMVRAGTSAGRAELATDAQANIVRSQFNAMQQEVSARIAKSTCPDVLHEVREQIGQVFRLASGSGAHAAAQALTSVRAQLADSRVRLDELRQHALDPDRADRLCESLARGHARVTKAPLHDAGHLLGWTIRADFDS